MNGERVEGSRYSGGGDHTEEITCPMCGEEMINNQLYDHLGDCEGGDVV